MRIGVFCSGGDAPGMNACLRAVVRAAAVVGHEVIGIRRGYQGLLDEDFQREGESILLSPRSVSGIVNKGGTMLGTSRSPEFQTVAGQLKASAILRRHGIDALIAIGGDGTYRGGMALTQHWTGQIIGCPGTIDNDLIGTDRTIGFDTAVATAVEAIDRLRDTAESHERMFLVEVMGRHNGHIALYSALAAGAEIACLPETSTDAGALVQQLVELKRRGKRSIIVVVAEGDECGGAVSLAEQIKSHPCPYSARVVILGHIQRGGSPVASDRILATRMGEYAVRALVAGASGQAVVEVGGQMQLRSLADSVAGHHAVSDELVRILDILAH